MRMGRYSGSSEAMIAQIADCADMDWVFPSARKREKTLFCVTESYTLFLLSIGKVCPQRTMPIGNEYEIRGEDPNTK